MGHHRIDMPLEGSTGPLPRVCVITGSREEVIDHPLELHLPWARAHRLLDRAGATLWAGGGLAAVGVGVLVRQRGGAGGWRVSLPFTRAAARRQRRDEWLAWLTSGLALHAPLAAFALLLLEKGFNGARSTWPGIMLLALPVALLLAGLTAWGLHRLLLAGPAVRLLRFQGEKGVLLLPSEEAADALYEHLQAEEPVQVDCPCCRARLATTRGMLGHRRRCPECRQKVTLGSSRPTVCRSR